ncbi:MAG: hypothetical protein BWY12_02359 [candidate division BRC1 bacterium ADurb.Bin183]|nr:MAG: hypothetical protein BWY12_02359 [candidate division BRC1 bacterium ADurb.Bin183]
MKTKICWGFLCRLFFPIIFLSYLRVARCDGAPDLAVTKIWHEGRTICFIIQNQGDESAPTGFDVSLFVGDGKKSVVYVDTALAPRQRYQACFDYVWECTGESDSISVLADYDNNVAESNEENNYLDDIWLCDTTPPQIIDGPFVTDITQDSAVISWETDEVSRDIVKYGTSPAPHEAQVDDFNTTTTHRVVLNNLESSTTYFYQIYSRDLYDNSSTTDDYTFDTATPPLPDLIITNIWSQGSNICFEEKNQGGTAAASHQTALYVDGAPVAFLVIPVTLFPEDTWQGCFEYNWQCSDVSDEIDIQADYSNTIEESNERNNFKSEIMVCEIVPLEITSGPAVRDTSSNRAVVVWMTNNAGDSFIKYGRMSRTYSSELFDNTSTKRHAIVLENLEAASTYHFKIATKDQWDSKVESKDLTFRTAAAPDGTAPIISLILPEFCSDMLLLSADASDNQGVSKVEFYLDDNLLGAAFSSPYQMKINTHKYSDGSHRFSAKAYDLSNHSALDEKLSEIDNKPNTTLPSVTIMYPLKGQTVSGDIFVQAEANDDNGIFSGTFYVDGKWAGNWFPDIEGSKNAPINIPWHTALETNALHRIAIQVYDVDLNVGTTYLDVDVMNAPPKKPAELNITRTIVSHSNYYTVVLNIANVGEEDARNIRLDDFCQLYQPVSHEDANAQYYSQFKTETTQWVMNIKMKNPLSGGQSVKLMYDIAPVLIYPCSVKPMIGGDKYTNATDVWFDDLYNTYHKRYPLVFCQAPYYTDALKTCDYLIVTSPRNLRFFNTQHDMDLLLTKMGELAILRKGALGYIDLPSNISIPFGLQWGLALGDMNDDGRDEIIIGNPISKHFYVYCVKPAKQCFKDIDHCYPIAWKLIADSTSLLWVDLFPLGSTLAAAKGTVAILIPSRGIVVEDSFGRTKYSLHLPDIDSYFGLAVGNITGDSELEYIIADYNNDKVYIYTAKNNKIGEFNIVNSVFDGFGAGDVMGDKYDEIILASQSAQKVFILSSNGAVLSSFNFPFEKGDRLAVGNVISTWNNDKKEIVISKYKEGKIRIFNAAGNQLKSINARFNMFDGLAAGNVFEQWNGDIIVGDVGFNNICIYNSGHQSSKPDILSELLKDSVHPALSYGASWKPSGAWSSLLKSGWTLDGYLLIVGETEIVPSFGDRWYGSILTKRGTMPLVSDCTDLPYANTYGDEIVPELNMGRIIGNSAQSLIKPIQASIDQIKGTSPKHFDRSNAIVLSGHPECFGGGGDHINFRSEADVIAAKLINNGTAVYQQDNTWCPSISSINDLFFQNTSTADVIFFAGHGNSVGCSDIEVADVVARTNPFGNTCPFIFASSCLTGRYTDGFGIAEAYFSQGAAAYLGATNWGVCCSHAGCSAQFFDRWQIGKTLGNAIQETKLFVAGDKYGNYWNAIYHLYGDPKFGTEGYQAQAYKKIEPATKIKISDNSMFLDIELPNFQVIQTNGIDHVSIPGGMTTFEVGMPIVPYFKTMVQYPKNTQIQDVFLLEKKDIESASGLFLPIGEIGIPETGGNIRTPRIKGNISEWYPEKTMEWTVIESPSSTTLAISLYPFYYNAQTTDVQYFRRYNIAVDAIVSDVQITRLETNKYEYDLGEHIAFMMELENQGSAPKNVVVSAAILQQGTSEFVSGLPLQSLNDIAGTASYNAVWDSAGFEQGYYAAEIEIRDDQAILLDKRTASFRLGSLFAQVSDLTATPSEFDIGDDIAISMTIANAGTIETSGTAVLLIRNSKGELIKKFQRDLPVLSGGESTIMNEVWKTTDEIFSAYFIVGFAYYGVQITEPIETIIRTKKPTGVIAY